MQTGRTGYNIHTTSKSYLQERTHILRIPVQTKTLVKQYLHSADARKPITVSGAPITQQIIENAYLGAPRRPH